MNNISNPTLVHAYVFFHFSTTEQQQNVSEIRFSRQPYTVELVQVTGFPFTPSRLKKTICTVKPKDPFSRQPYTVELVQVTGFPFNWCF